MGQDLGDSDGEEGAPAESVECQPEEIQSQESHETDQTQVPPEELE